MSAQSHAAQGLPRQPIPFILRYAPDGQWQGHILQCRILGQIIVVLKDEADIAAAESCPLLLVHSLQMMLASDDDLPFGGRLQSCQHIQKSRFSGTAAARNADKFTMQHRYVHAIQCTDSVSAHGIVFF